MQLDLAFPWCDSIELVNRPPPGIVLDTLKKPLTIEEAEGYVWRRESSRGSLAVLRRRGGSEITDSGQLEMATTFLISPSSQNHPHAIP